MSLGILFLTQDKFTHLILLACSAFIHNYPVCMTWQSVSLSVGQWVSQAVSRSNSQPVRPSVSQGVRQLFSQTIIEPAS